uniref:Meiosis-specific nuclear structural protein 1 n=1 Tax=Romanomermis culicivorax TaxID=13658 RepID=A0A915JJ38_ROMCU
MENIQIRLQNNTKINQYETIKEQKRRELAKLQKDMLENCEKEALIFTETKEQKQNALNEMEKIIFPKKSDEYSKSLLEKLLAEQEECKKKFSDEQALYIRQNEENFLKLKLQDYDNLRKRDIEIKQQQMNDLLKNLSSDEQMQKRALLILMQRKDERMTTIQNQLQMIQDELTKLTIAEMKNRDIKDSIIQQQLVDQREGLKLMINILMEERKNRAREFRKIMIENK